jgi:hypothetical protein
MDIGPTDIAVVPVTPGEGIRRVESRSDAQQSPHRRQPHDEPPDEEERESLHDTVDVSLTYRETHPDGGEQGLTEATAASIGEPGQTPHIDIEA